MTITPRQPKGGPKGTDSCGRNSDSPRQSQYPLSQLSPQSAPPTLLAPQRATLGCFTSVTSGSAPSTARPPLALHAHSRGVVCAVHLCIFFYKAASSDSFILRCHSGHLSDVVPSVLNAKGCAGSTRLSCLMHQRLHIQNRQVLGAGTQHRGSTSLSCLRSAAPGSIPKCHQAELSRALGSRSCVCSCLRSLPLQTQRSGRKDMDPDAGPQAALCYERLLLNGFVSPYSLSVGFQLW